MIPRFLDGLEHMVQNQHNRFLRVQVLYSMIEEQSIWAEDIVGNFWAEIDYIEDYGRILEYRKNGK